MENNKAQNRSNSNTSSNCPPYGAQPEEWEDPAWQLRNSFTTREKLAQALQLSAEENAALDLAPGRLSIAITPYFLSLINPQDEHDPIRLQVIARMGEFETSPCEQLDPLGEEQHMVLPGLVHRYPDRVLIIATSRCATYCRYCTRARLVSGACTNSTLQPDWKGIINYLQHHTEIRDVLISGGDPLLLSDNKLRHILEQLRAIPHIELLRIGTRIPIVLPQRITPALCQLLREYAPLFISIHCNHPNELAPRAQQALSMLVDHGIPLGSQSVLLKGINDKVSTQRQLYHKLLQNRVRPYYLYQCDLIQGSSHFRTSLEIGLDIMDALRGHTSGYALPQYVVDAPMGGGKIHLNRQTIIGQENGMYQLLNFKGGTSYYPV